MHEAGRGMRTTLRRTPRSSAIAHGGLILTLFAALGCGAGEAAPARGPDVGAASDRGASPYFPLEDGKIYHYVTSEAGETGMLVAKVHRSDATRGELRTSSGAKRFVLAPDGVRYEGGPYLLKEPVEVGASWPGEHDGTTVVEATDLSVEVEAGRYASCVRTVEEGGRVPGARYEATYCPGVGMVLLVVTAGDVEARVELKSYGMPVVID